MGKYRPSGVLIIGGEHFQTDAPIVNFEEGPLWSALNENLIATNNDPSPWTRPGAKQVAPNKWTAWDADHKGNFTLRCQPRHSLRNSKWNNGYNAPYDAAKQVIRQFMIHHDGCADADMCFTVVHNERGLSVHFICDNDGTIFQTLDLAMEGWHGSELNAASIGVEMCNRGDAAREPNYYTQRKMQRDVKPCVINGHKIRSFDFTQEQREAMQKLGRALQRLLPNLPAEFPQSSPGQQLLSTMPFGEISRFAGYIGHYHLTSNKWDPGPWDFKDFMTKIRGAFSWPSWPQAPEKDQPMPAIPKTASELKEQAAKLAAMNEARADGGYFPIGPWGEARLWHGGVHLAEDAGAKVFAPFPGRLVAARMGTSTLIGSVNFVLLRHEMRIADRSGAQRKLEFYSLYMHLADELRASTPVEWLGKAKVDKNGKPRELRSGAVWLLDEPIEAGSVIGHVGTAGPVEVSKPQLHLELFANSDMFDGMPGSPWESIDGSNSGRFCDVPRITENIDNNRNGILNREELKAFFTSGGGQAFYFTAIRHVSEWTAEPSWVDALRVPKDFRDKKPEWFEQLVADQIAPGLWWTEEVARHARLPPDGVVYHYHPINFIRWLNDKLIEAADQAGPGEDLSDAGKVPDGITDDRSGGDMISKDAFQETDTCNEKIGLKELVMGFDAPECGT